MTAIAEKLWNWMQTIIQFKNKKSIETWKYGSHFRLIVQALLNDLEKKTPSLLFSQAYSILALIFFHCPTNRYTRISSYGSDDDEHVFNSELFQTAMSYARSCWRNEEEFKLFADMSMAMYGKYAPIARLDKNLYYSYYTIDALILSRYNLQGKLSDDAFMELLLNDEGEELRNAGDYIYNTRGHRLTLLYEDEKNVDVRYGKETYKNLERIINKIAQHLFKIEMTRLNAPTTASNIIIRINDAMVLQGAEYMVTAMKALGKDHLIASSYGTEKRAVLTDIIERTFPLETDEPEILKTIKDDRLLELAYFAPQWVPLIKAHLNWEASTLPITTSLRTQRRWAKMRRGQQQHSSPTLIQLILPMEPLTKNSSTKLIPWLEKSVSTCSTRLHDTLETATITVGHVALQTRLSAR